MKKTKPRGLTAFLCLSCCISGCVSYSSLGLYQNSASKDSAFLLSEDNGRGYGIFPVFIWISGSGRYDLEAFCCLPANDVEYVKLHDLSIVDSKGNVLWTLGEVDADGNLYEPKIAGRRVFKNWQSADCLEAFARFEVEDIHGISGKRVRIKGLVTGKTKSGNPLSVSFDEVLNFSKERLFSEMDF